MRLVFQGSSPEAITRMPLLVTETLYSQPYDNEL